MASENQFGARIELAAQALGMEMSDVQNRQLQDYIGQLQRWNRVYNLTALRQPEQMLVQHIFDSLSVVGPIGKILDKNTVSNTHILDIGSGAGLPGVVLAIMMPGLQVQCVDAVEKKMAFVRQMSGALGLNNLLATHARIEKLAPAGANVVISRAFASLADFALLGGPHVAPGGKLVAMKGQRPDEEMAALEKNGWRVHQVEPLNVPELNAQRCLVWMSRQGNL